MKQNYIIIVEDNKLLYDRLADKLTNENFEVGPYTPSFEAAIENIEKRTPDLMLLDIMLEGEQNGIDLGEVINKKYHIPFIYVTELDNDYYFHKALQTKHRDFIPKTVSHDNFKKILRSIYTILEHKKYENISPAPVAREPDNIKLLGVEGMVDYADKLKYKRFNEISKLPVKFEDILFFSRDNYTDDDGKNHQVPSNYVWFLTNTGKRLFLYISLSELCEKLPSYFVRINVKIIINLKYIDGRINVGKVRINNKFYKVTKVYKNKFIKRYKNLYISEK